MKRVYGAGAACFMVALWCMGATQAHAQDGEWSLSMLRKPVHLVPSVGVAVGWSKRTGDEATRAPISATHPTLWAGLTLHPMADTVSPFVSVGVEIEPHDFDNGAEATYYMPMLRTGVAWQGWCYDTKEINYLTSMFPCMSIYGLMGVRPNLPGRSPSLRMGVGVNLFVFTVAAAMADLFVPSTFEGIIEQDLEGHTLTMFRIGFGF